MHVDADLRLAVLGAAAALGLSRTVRLSRWAGHGLPHVLGGGERPGAVTAVVPARNEADSVERCVTALRRSGEALAEVVVVDDDSTDATAMRAALAGARVVASTSPRAGELGKPVACAAGAATSSGEWLWFVDADVEVAPLLLTRLLRHADETGADLVSCLGRLVTRDATVGWLLPAVGFAVARRHQPAAVADPTSPEAFAAGHCLLVRRAAYEAGGGHRAVADEVIDDVALARLLKRRGYAVSLVAAWDGFEVRMYDDRRALWTGLLRNSTVVRRPWGRAALAAGLSLAPVVLASSRRGRARRVARLVVGAQVGAELAARAVARQPLRPAVLAPVVDSVLLIQHGQAARLARRGATVRWRGRAVRPG